MLEKHRLKEKGGVRKQRSRITSLEMENGAALVAHYFADATYEGDLMAQAGVSYTVGREGTDQYGESLAGVQAFTRNHQFAMDISPWDENGKLSPQISPAPRGKPGSAERRVQAYNFRVIATNVPENRLPWPQPDNYDPQR
ncbi:MAG: FAD-dependent oxidoreductase [Bryobacteraceae bacterium]|nr:FAD-dependent oxidoreductase [Bryobacteraceae bacterium]MDW8379535.1 FAD-dependent oxidoreductase [Bryobacterales bacterium]